MITNNWEELEWQQRAALFRYYSHWHPVPLDDTVLSLSHVFAVSQLLHRGLSQVGGPVLAGLRPTLSKLLKEEWVSEGAAVDDDMKQVDKCHHQAADQKKRQERTQLSPDHTYTIPQTTLVPRMGCEPWDNVWWLVLGGAVTIRAQIRSGSWGGRSSQLHAGQETTSTERSKQD